MSKLTKSKSREIIDEFAKEIAKAKRLGPKPAKWVIDFRTEVRDGYERDVYHVPIDLLLYRKDNGRISSDVYSYEKYYGPLDEMTEEAQEIIQKFLKEKDPEKSRVLKQSIEHGGQREPAIITCDGFLINGNRRKMVMEILVKEGKSDFKTMRVVILPGKDDKKEGGPPSLLEIEELENRCQLQSQGKAEYSKFDKALSMRRKKWYGMSLEEQLLDDPAYAGLSKKDFRKKIKEFEEDYLKPLECIDRYLELLGRPRLYDTIATGYGDREGRWEAFYDYSSKVYKKISNPKERMKMGIEESDVGDIENACFKIIRMRKFPDLPKAHMIMRDIGNKWLDKDNKDSKKALIKLVEIDLQLSENERLDKNGKEYDEREKDKIWGQKYGSEIINLVKKAKYAYDHKKVRETPLSLLEAALKKLNHEDMDPTAINISDYPKARALTVKIQERARKLESEFYHHQKSTKKLKQRYSNR